MSSQTKSHQLFLCFIRQIFAVAKLRQNCCLPLQQFMRLCHFMGRCYNAFNVQNIYKSYEHNTHSDTPTVYSIHRCGFVTIISIRFSSSVLCILFKIFTYILNGHNILSQSFSQVVYKWTGNETIVHSTTLCYDFWWVLHAIALYWKKCFMFVQLN